MEIIIESLFFQNYDPCFFDDYFHEALLQKQPRDKRAFLIYLKKRDTSNNDIEVVILIFKAINGNFLMMVAACRKYY